MIDVKKRYLVIIKEILTKYVPDCEVRAFGSRVKGDARSYSDLDLVLVCKEKVPLNVLYGIKEAFENSTIPFRVEVQDWNRISEEFKKVIEGKYEIVRKRISVKQENSGQNS